MVFFSTAQMVAWGVTLDTASVLLVGGLLSLGLGGVINAVDVLGDRYGAADRSRVFPGRDLAMLCSFLDRPTAFQAVNAFRDALRTQSPR